jgi:SAM-dependent methyltransferase
MEAAAAWGAAPWQPMAQRLAPIHDHLVQLLGPRTGERGLDVGTGTGAVAIRAARAGAHVTGVDLSPGMVRAARRLAIAQDVRAQFAVGDAQRLPYADGRFDVVASALGLFLAPDHRRVTSELARVTRPGGRLGSVAWRPDPGLQALHATHTGGSADRRLWGREEYVRELLDRNWELEFAPGEIIVTASSGDELWRLYTTSDGPARMRIEAMSPLERARYRRAYVDHHERFRVNSQIRLPRRYLITLGRRRAGSGPRRPQPRSR